MEILALIIIFYIIFKFLNTAHEVNDGNPWGF
jgi:hypothetical protein